MFDKLSDNLNLLMTEAHISADELARRTGVPASTIKKIRNRYNPNPTLSTLLPLTQFFKITLGQLVGDEPFDQERQKGTYDANLIKLKYLPIISWPDAITWPARNSDSEYKTITSEYDYSSDAYALIVEEEDWENLAKGTALLIEPNLQPEHRDFIILYKKGSIIPTLKQLLIDEDQIYLKAIISGYNIIPLSTDHTVLGVVVEYKKCLKFEKEICL